MSTGSKVALAIFIPFLMFSSAFYLGIIEFSPKNTLSFLENLDNTKQEIIEITKGERTIEESFGRVQKQVDETAQKTGTTFDNVIKYAKKTVDPSIPDEEKPQFDADEIEQLVHDFTNQQRKKNGLSELDFDNKIADIARAHSLDMAYREYFAHETPEGLSPTDRAERADYSCTKMVGIMIYSGLAENIFQGHLYNSYYTINGVITSYDWNTNEEIADITVQGWMDSPGHRKNILTDMFDHEGIGVIITEDDKVYVTQNFC